MTLKGPRYRLMILVTEGQHKGYYFIRTLNTIFELAYLYEKCPDVIERCDYILDTETGEYLGIFDKDRIVNKAKRIAEYDPFKF